MINKGVQTGYTCDSTLCTRECNDNDLVNLACADLNTVRGLGNNQGRNRGSMQLLRQPALRLQRRCGDQRRNRPPQ